MCGYAYKKQNPDASKAEFETYFAGLPSDKKKFWRDEEKKAKTAKVSFSSLIVNYSHLFRRRQLLLPHPLPVSICAQLFFLLLIGVYSVLTRAWVRARQEWGWRSWGWEVMGTRV
jgi:hypothetical protein